MVFTNLKKYQKVKNIKLIHGGDEYFLLLENLIQKAKEKIYFHTFIFNNDEIGQRIAKALIDAYGSAALYNSEILREMIKNKINFRFFSSFFSLKSVNLGRRLHQKVVV